jgi:hypothetical protein
MADPSKDEKKRYYWLDADDVRCSPYHTKFSEALAFYEDPHHQWVTTRGVPHKVQRHLGHLPSQSKPVRLRKMEWVEVPLTDREFAAFDEMMATR